MREHLKAQLVIIGGGAAGLSVAAGAVQMGASVILVESGRMGGDCLNYGCVPSKALLAAAKTADTIRHASRFGIASTEPSIDFAKVMQNVQSVIQTISKHDSVERFESLGVQVIQARGEFLDKNTLIAGDKQICAKRFVIATGSSAAIPPIPGLDQVPYYTNETLFELTEAPKHLIIIGGGPIGCEMAQAFLSLGVPVTILEAKAMLPRDDQALVGILKDTLEKQGLKLYQQVKVESVSQQAHGIEVQIQDEHGIHTIQGSHLLVAAGRKPNLEHLNLPTAGIISTSRGITVDNRLRTNHKHIYAIGDVTGHFPFTHTASYHAGIVIRNALFRIPAKIDYRAVPWVTYTHPELAQVGLTEMQALHLNPKNKILSFDMADIDRAQTEHETIGKIKVMTSPKGLVLGVSLLAANAGELIVPWIKLVAKQQHIREMTDLIIPYPTLSDIHKRVAGSFYTPALFSKRTQRLVRFLNRLG